MKTKKLLLAEDNDDLRPMLADVLRHEGYEVVATRDEDEWAAVLDQESHLDIVLTDVEMPGQRNGIALASLVEAKHPEACLIVMSGRSRSELAGMPGTATFIPKPFRISDLLRHIGTACSRANRTS